jgi:hypothetical protein
VSDLQELVDKWALIRQEIDEIEEIVSVKNKEKSAIEMRLIEIMKELSLDKFSGKFGKIQLREINYVTLPQTEEQQAQFFNYLKSTDQFDMLASIHHQKLQSWYKNKIEEEGLVPVPGLDPMKTRYEIRKGR